MTALPLFVSAGEALTDMIQVQPGVWHSRVGGAGFNVARAMAALGVPSAFAGAVSQDVLGDALARSAVEAALDTRFLQRCTQAPLLAMVYATAPPAYFFIGDDSADLYFEPSALPTGWQAAVRCVHFGGISLSREPLAARLVALARELKSRGTLISYDPNFRPPMDERYDPVLHAMVALADVVKVSDEDLVGLFRTSDVTAAFQRLQALNPDARLLLTRGALGAEFHHQGRSWRAAPPPVTVIDSIGAGDASVSALLQTLVEHPDADGAQLLRRSVAAGAAACLQAGAAPPSRRDVQALVDLVAVERLVSKDSE